MYCTKLTGREISYLTRILKHEPDVERTFYTSRVKTLLSYSLTPSCLKRPFRLSVLFFFFSRSARTTTPDALELCVLHRRLNAHTVHSLFNRLVRELGRNVNFLVRHRQVLGVEQGDLVERLRHLHAVLSSPDDYARPSLAPPSPTDRKHHIRPNRCEACILALVGGHQDVLLDLWTLLLSRTETKTRTRPSTSLAFVEAWLCGLRIEDQYGVLDECWEEAKELRTMRERIRTDRARVRERKERRGATEPEPEPELEFSRVTDVRDVPDLENAAAAAAATERGDGGNVSGAHVETDIIDHYTALNSTLRLASSLAPGSGTTAIESASSCVSGTTRAPSRAWNRPAEDQARSYQNLLATTPPPQQLLQDESAWEEDSVAEEQWPQVQDTLWSVVLRAWHIAKKRKRRVSGSKQKMHETRGDNVEDDQNLDTVCSAAREWEDAYGQATAEGERLERTSQESDWSDTSVASVLVHTGGKGGMEVQQASLQWPVHAEREPACRVQSDGKA